MRKYEVVKITVDDDGERTGDDSWHLSVHGGGTSSSLCGGEAYGSGQSSAEFVQRAVNFDEKAVTCPKCIEQLKFFKKVPI